MKTHSGRQSTAFSEQPTGSALTFNNSTKVGDLNHKYPFEVADSPKRCENPRFVGPPAHAANHVLSFPKEDPPWPGGSFQCRLPQPSPRERDEAALLAGDEVLIRGQNDLVQDEAVLAHPQVERVDAGSIDDEGGRLAAVRYHRPLSSPRRC
jgi:hypothetical protein